MPDVLLTVGTRKGLFIGRRQAGRWEFDDPAFPSQAVYSVAVDTRGPSPRVLVGGDSAHWGPSVFHSDDLGRSWTEPARPAVKFPEDTGASLERVWQLHPAPAHSPRVVYAGTEPAALFRSADGGESFELVRPLWEHPTRRHWVPGGGGEAVHTVVTDRRDPDALTVAVSTAGVFRSRDGGADWDPSNDGVSAVFLPDPHPEFGQCVHKIAQDSGDPDRLYLQNHWGVYRSDDAGVHWTDIGAGLPSDFGFAVAAHPHRPDTAYVFPITADSDRVPAGRRCRVYRTTDAGETWEPLAEGLPRGDHYGTVLRDALCTDDADPAGVYFGNRNGELYASADDGDSWSLLAEHLPDVLCVRAAVV
ncbi:MULTISPECIES: WD40/YVTN/BNR-like repeat-containing protein [unclassified Streptomyces]|uniref:WD40/YVTN/BNR-like repeat-containing protein n=1 Tax=unclassified Streptomyces TaxID=2593676 RepID=UPI00166091BD|nr:MULTISPECIES: exo-alpha-sialidase [unclassified Streptomyces]MBD0706980.1 glycosyl hydrolase [Streptomyces sp. CBMA291]MBD0710333.1 glycosyl hydrolase [Streptomyces sp. CBMA291]MBD0717290.1 glycosyl hydrolase [Streptomyces sp. CBMA370]